MKTVTIDTKKFALVLTALMAAGIDIGTIISYMLDLVLGGPQHDWGNAISVEIRKVVDNLIADPIGFGLNVAVDVTIVSLLFKLAGWMITMFGGKKSIQVAPGVRWRYA